MYEQQLNEYAAKATGLEEYLLSKEGKKLSRSARAKFLEEASRQSDMQVPGVPGGLPHAVPQGPLQLDALTTSGEWCLTIVDVKMTTNQTAQGKKSRFSAMVMVGNLAVRFVYSQYADGPGCASRGNQAGKHALCSVWAAHSMQAEKHALHMLVTHTLCEKSETHRACDTHCECRARPDTALESPRKPT